MTVDTQPTLENETIALLPLAEKDFDGLYETASDPKIWEQHPNKDRWRKEVFSTFFDGALQSKGAFKIIDKTSGNIIGCTRFYDYDHHENIILIGYTFFSTQCWGKGINHTVKSMMLDYMFQFVSRVHFHIGAENIRSQIAICRLGAVKVGEKEVAYFGEPSKLNFVYEIKKQDWLLRERPHH